MLGIVYLFCRCLWDCFNSHGRNRNVRNAGNVSPPIKATRVTVIRRYQVSPRMKNSLTARVTEDQMKKYCCRCSSEMLLSSGSIHLPNTSINFPIRSHQNEHHRRCSAHAVLGKNSDLAAVQSNEISLGVLS